MISLNLSFKKEAWHFALNPLLLTMDCRNIKSIRAFGNRDIKNSAPVLIINPKLREKENKNCLKNKWRHIVTTVKS